MWGISCELCPIFCISQESIATWKIGTFLRQTLCAFPRLPDRRFWWRCVPPPILPFEASSQDCRGQLSILRRVMITKDAWRYGGGLLGRAKKDVISHFVMLSRLSENPREYGAMRARKTFCTPQGGPCFLVALLGDLTALTHFPVEFLCFSPEFLSVGKLSFGCKSSRLTSPVSLLQEWYWSDKHS